MGTAQHPRRVLILVIDGLRQDVFHSALHGGRLPHMAELLGSAPLHLDPVSTAPSITMCAQTSLFTGAHPNRHGIMGNQLFDRFAPTPRFYAFDIGDTLAVDDAVFMYTSPGLLNETISIQTPTLYEWAGGRGLACTVVHHMVSRGAHTWLPPSLAQIARFTKGAGTPLGLSAEQFDQQAVKRTLEHLKQGHQPDLLTVYFMGVDHKSHALGPGAQANYLTDVLDGLIGKLANGLKKEGWLENCLTAVVSDHGQIEVIPDDRHSLRISFPFDREMGYLFDALGLDVHDLPGEDPACDAVVAANGGLAHVYLQNRQGRWADAPDFERDVLPVARAFWAAHSSGKYAPDLQGALSAVLVRNVQTEGWEADYRALTPQGEIVELEAFLAGLGLADAPARLHHLAGPRSGDLLLVSDSAAGFYFGAPTVGVHGGLQPGESLCVASFGWPQGRREALDQAAARVVQGRASIVHLMPMIQALIG